ncbi:protein aurora borealis [Drosophila guanche]|uniref:Protein aurora borealis n=1 Tax=Drosophila guanche TaxID=7266 RepID=A0A3B0JWB6_DROGU|nr:protein aurora borealis [Drosophila guanche]SPP77001.1 blast:Protein aurora borealis [Drosophila guanche]
MYTDEVRTPHSLKSRYFSNLTELKCRVRRNSATANNSVASSGTPTNGGKQNTRCSPQMSSLVCTPPPKRFHKIRNPFEGALADRLHLPLIASPSLFRSRTPQLSSTQFEWNIDEVAQLKPADVEPHETQFHDSPDPEVENKAQLAISAFFKESLIVPSPVDCPLRKNRIILNELNEDLTPISKKSSSGRRHRDCSVQTELSLPPILPKALEDALRPYLQPHLAGSMSGRAMSRSSGSDIFNSSMRRKLFDLHNVIVLGEQEAAQSPQMVGSSPQGKQTMFAGRLSDSASGEGDGSFGSLSPIRNLCGLPTGTPDDGNRSSKRKLLLMHDLDLPSPIAPSEHLSRRLVHSKVEVSISTSEQHDTLSELTGSGRPACRFTPDRSSSPMQALEQSDSSINQRVSRLRVNSTRQLPSQSLLETVEQAETEDTDEPEAEPETDDEEGEEEAEAMQLSTLSFNCSSSNSDTPRGSRRRRSANRKNLSQSFSANLDEVEEPQQVETAPPVANPPAQRVGLYRADSGFNETSSTSTFACSQDISMACCSTPSTRS